MWNAVPFAETSRAQIPKQRGLYCFLARPAVDGLPPVGYPLYVGETGDKSRSHLQRRFSEYLVERKKPKRMKMLYVFEELQDHIVFAYTEILDPHVSLKNLEARLTDALVPPYSDDDFSAAMRPSVPIARR